MQRGRGAARAIVAMAALVVLSGCVEKIEQVQAPTATAGSGSDPSADSVVEQFAGDPMSFGVVPAAPTVASGEPIRVGMINQEGTPLGSFPELRLGVEAAVEFINTELGGIDGQPIELISCITAFSVEQSQACAQQMVQEDVVAVLGGIDITSNGSIPILEQNGIPYVGGIPASFAEMRSPISFQFSGGFPGAMVAFADHAANEQGATKVAVAYGDYESIKAGALDYGVATLRAEGVTDITEIPFPITTTDFLPIMTKAAEGDPDAIFMGVADTACAPVMQIARDLGIEATLYFTGACAAPGIAEQVGPEAIDGNIFNIENPVGDESIEFDLYSAVVDRYGDPALPAASAATVTFKAAMNLYALLTELGPDTTPAALLDLLRAARERPSFDGHPYTCDGQQVPDLPALCSPQQILVQSRDGGLDPVTGWVDVPAILRG